ncbi:hypothetical protein TNCV_1895491 [Trichonephila clavipes]|nr:hypothetical protein TNCV_1895491 [Trichonephila clavipes]
MHSRLGSICVKKTSSSWRASTHHGVQQGRQCAVHLANTRHGAYLDYTQNILIQHQGENPTGKPDPPYLRHPLSTTPSTNPTAVSLRGHRREIPPAD